VWNGGDCEDVRFVSEDGWGGDAHGGRGDAGGAVVDVGWAG